MVTVTPPVVGRIVVPAFSRVGNNVLTLKGGRVVDGPVVVVVVVKLKRLLNRGFCVRG